MITCCFPRCGASTAHAMAGWLAALLVCYEDASPIAASPAPTLLVSEARGGHPRHRRDRSKRPRGPPAGVPRLAAHWAAVDALTAVVRARPREAPRSRQKHKAMLRAATRVAARHARRPPPRRRALAAVQYLPAQAAPMLLSTASPLALGGRPLLDGALASSSSVVASVAGGDNKDDDGR